MPSLKSRSQTSSYADPIIREDYSYSTIDPDFKNGCIRTASYTYIYECENEPSSLVEWLAYHIIVDNSL